MLEDSNQSQNSGKKSVNVQAGGNINITTGMSYTEAKEIALDVFHSNYQKMVSEASETVTERIQYFVNEYLQKLKNVDPKLFENLKRPDIQSSLFDAQKEYAKTGDNDLGNLLLVMLVERTALEKRTIDQIYLDEALKVVPRLTQQQIDFITLNYVCYYAIPAKFKSVIELVTYFETHLSPLLLSFKDIEIIRSEEYSHFIGYPSSLGCSTIPPDDHTTKPVLLLVLLSKLIHNNDVVAENKLRQLAVYAASLLKDQDRTLSYYKLKFNSALKEYQNIIPGIGQVENLYVLNANHRLLPTGKQIAITNFKVKTGLELLWYSSRDLSRGYSYESSSDETK